jgi:hypothetical protein
MPALLGLQEATRLFGLSSQQNLSAVVRQGRFAPADYHLSGSPQWRLDTLIKTAPEMREVPHSVVGGRAAGRGGAAPRRHTGAGSVIVPRGRAAKAV